LWNSGIEEHKKKCIILHHTVPSGFVAIFLKEQKISKILEQLATIQENIHLPSFSDPEYSVEYINSESPHLSFSEHLQFI
jgi:hypothetical protein